MIPIQKVASSWQAWLLGRHAYGCVGKQRKKGQIQRKIAICNGETYSDLEVQY